MRSSVSGDLDRQLGQVSLLNCLGKIVERVVADLISRHCEATGGFHPGQYGCRTKRSAVDAVGVAIAQSRRRVAEG